jgi:hypothetical protein
MNNPIYSPPPPICTGAAINGRPEFGRPGFGALPYLNSNLSNFYNCSPYYLNGNYFKMFGS